MRAGYRPGQLALRQPIAHPSGAVAAANTRHEGINATRLQ
jgi:hypothetical protein